MLLQTPKVSSVAVYLCRVGMLVVRSAAVSWREVGLTTHSKESVRMLAVECCATGAR